MREFSGVLFGVARALALVCLLVCGARANFEIWAGDTTGNWSAPSNWTSGHVPAAGDDVYIINSDGISRTITYDYDGPAVTLATMYLNGGSGSATDTLYMSFNNLSVSGEEVVGNGGGGVLSQTGGTNQAGAFRVGDFSGSTGSYNLIGGSVSAVGSGIGETVGNSGNGTFTQTGGTNNSGALILGYFPGSIGVYQQTGGILSGTSEVVGWAGSGTFAQTGGTNTIASGYTLVLGLLESSIGTYTLEGGTMSAPDVYLGGYHGGGGLILPGGTGTLSVSDSGALAVTGVLKVYNTPGSRIDLSGGTINTGSLDLSGVQSRLHWTGGTLGITGSGGLTIDASGPLGTTQLTAAKTLNVTSTTTVTSGYALTIDGGSFSTGALANSGIVVFNSGSMTVGGASTNAGRIELGGNQAIVFGPDVLANTGLVRGEGSFLKSVINLSDGEIRAENGSQLYFSDLSINQGRIVLQGGTVEVASLVTNSGSGQIIGRGTLEVGSTGLVNQGSVSLSSGITDVFGKVRNETGSASKGIVITGNADVTFWDDVTNTSGLFKVNAGGSATFFGAFSGNGISGSGGTVDFEGTVSPGASPAAVTFDGDVRLGGAASLTIELGGVSQGTQYDHVSVAGNLALDGVLSVSLLGGYAPVAGNSFDILDWQTKSGAFSTVQLPMLAGGLGWNTSQLYTNGVLSVVSVGVPGDYNNNGRVDAGDYVSWRKGGPLANEVDAPGTVNGVDYAAWRARFGNPGGSGAGAGSGDPRTTAGAVPEPGAAWLATIALVAMAVGRRRGSKTGG